MRNHFLRAAAGNAGGAPGTSITFNEYQLDTNNLSSYSFTNVDIGTAAADRLVVVVACASGGSLNTNISNVTIGGTNGSLVVEENGPSFTSHEMWSLPVSSGTTATVGVTVADGASRCFIAVYSLYGLNNNTAVDANNGNSLSSTTTDTLTGLSSGSCVIASVQQDNSGIDISNVTKDVDNLAIEARYITVGHATTTTSGNFSMTYTLTNPSLSTFVSAAFR